MRTRKRSSTRSTNRSGSTIPTQGRILMLSSRLRHFLHCSALRPTLTPRKIGFSWRNDPLACPPVWLCLAHVVLWYAYGNMDVAVAGGRRTTGDHSKAQALGRAKAGAHLRSTGPSLHPACRVVTPCGTRVAWHAARRRSLRCTSARVNGVCCAVMQSAARHVIYLMASLCVTWHAGASAAAARSIRITSVFDPLCSGRPPLCSSSPCSTPCRSSKGRAYRTTAP